MKRQISAQFTNESLKVNSMISGLIRIFYTLCKRNLHKKLNMGQRCSKPRWIFWIATSLCFAAIYLWILRSGDVLSKWEDIGSIAQASVNVRKTVIVEFIIW